MLDCLIINTGVGNFEAIKNVLNYIGLVSKISHYKENLMTINLLLFLELALLIVLCLI